MDTTKLIEEAGQLTTEEFASGATNGPWRVDDLVVIMAGEEAVAECFSVKDARFIARARTLVPELAAALKASEERATAAELDAASLRAAWKIADRTSLTAECQAHAKTSFDLLGVVKERDALAAANLVANKRIVELEHECEAERRKVDALLESSALLRGERDVARAELARLTTPRPIAEAPRDGTVILGLWAPDLAHPVPVAWMEDLWLADFGPVAKEPSHYLPLPEVKP